MLAAALLTLAVTPPSGAANVSAVSDLLERLLPGLSQHFELQLSPTMQPGCFSLDDVEDLPGHQINLVAADVPSLTAGAGYYLMQRANLTIGWQRGGGSRIAEPAGSWPTMAASGGRADVCRAVPHSYFMNVCTHSYSLVWYGWREWSALLDWMALHGINLYLALTGQEEIQYRVFRHFGLADADIRRWFNGPAFLTWSRGQNEYGAGIAGPLPRSFMLSQFALQQKIVARGRSLGLVGQLPGFQGNVPIQLKAVLRDSNITQQGATGWMDSLDPAFGRVADVWMHELTSAFGTDHWYQLDGYFNGGTAPWLDGRVGARTPSTPSGSGTGAPTLPDPLWRQRGAAAYGGLNRTDPAAIWSFQGFAFESWHGEDKARAIRGFIDSAPRGKFVIIDMDYGEGEWLNWGDPCGFWDTGFVWSKLHNFGGTDGIKGNMTRAAELPFRAKRASANILGTGFTSEGIFQNTAYYELILDANFRTAPTTPTDYVMARALRRYDVYSHPSNAAAAAAAATHAWRLLAASVYSQDVSVQDGTGVTHLPGTSKWSFAADRRTPTALMCQLYEAWSALLDTATLLTTASGASLAEPLRYDLVDVGREVLAQLLTPLSMNVSDALHATPHADPPTVDLYGDAYVALLADLDTLVATDATFLLGSWLEMARNVGSAHLDVHPRGDGVGANATSATADDLSADVASDDCTGASAPTVPPEVQGCGHFYEWNARCQLTTWNPVPQGATKQPSGPIDYASKHWSGLLSDYYRKRAVLLMSRAKALAAEGKPLDAAADDAVRASHSYAFQVATKTYPVKPVGDALLVSRQMHAKYGPALERACAA